MESVKVQYAKTHLSALLAEVEKGHEYVIARGEHDVARLVPIVRPTRRDLGFLSFELADTFFDPLPDAELAAWDGQG